MGISEKYIKELNSKIDSHEWINDLVKGWYLDWKDSVSNWWVGRIIEDDEEKEEFNIHFDGWSVKYDEFIPHSSNRNEPFRMITKGYTGMRNTTKREEWTYKAEDMEDLKERVEDTIKQEFDNFKTAFEVTQFLRGEVFFYC